MKNKKRKMKLLKEIAGKLEKLNVDEYALSYNEEEASQVKFANSKIVKNGYELSKDIGLFVNYKKRLGVTLIKSFDEKDIENSISALINFVKKTEQNKEFKGLSEGDFRYKELENCYDKKFDDIDEEDAVEEGINIANEYAEKAAGIFDKYKGKSYLITSHNIEGEEEYTKYYYSIKSIKNEGSGYDTFCSRIFNRKLIKESALKASKIANDSQKPSEIEEGKYDVVFGMPVTNILLNEIANHACMFNVESGLSFLAGKLNQKIGKITLKDDARLENGFNSCKFDDEGTPSGITIILDNGILKTYLHNYSSAKRNNMQNTGNAGLIMQRASNIVLEKGECEEGDVNDIENGLYITNSWYTRFQNYRTGDFSTIPRDGIFLIKKGKIEKAVKNIRITDNMLNLLNNIEKIGKEIKQMKTWEADIPVMSREILIRNVNITKPKI